MTTEPSSNQVPEPQVKYTKALGYDPDADIVDAAVTESSFDGSVPQSSGISNMPLMVLPEGATKGDVIQLLGQSVPLNEYQLPTFFYRSDLLPYGAGGLTMEEADVAVVSLDYYEGYPTFNGGMIFWNQLPHEPMKDYLLFQRYLEQAEETGLRQLQMLSIQQHVKMETVLDCSREYMWSWRARAYDLFQVAADRKRRELRARKVENVHYDRAGALLAALETKFAGEPEEWLAELTAKEALEVMVNLMKVQRMSVGLAANGNAGGAPVNPDAAASGADLMRDITRNLPGATESLGIDTNLQALLSDPSFAQRAQTLIIQVRHGAETETIDPAIIEGRHRVVPNDA